MNPKQKPGFRISHFSERNLMTLTRLKHKLVQTCRILLLVNNQPFEAETHRWYRLLAPHPRWSLLHQVLSWGNAQNLRQNLKGCQWEYLLGRDFCTKNNLMTFWFHQCQYVYVLSRWGRVEQMMANVWKNDIKYIIFSYCCPPTPLIRNHSTRLSSSF